MYIKTVSKTERLKKLESTVKRLPEHHPTLMLMKQDLIKQKSGYKGEKSLLYYLDQLPEKEYYIFHNLRLPHRKSHFQIDFLILCNRFAIILECKNFFGELFFDHDFHQLIRITNHQEEGFPDPISQVKWQKQQLSEWLDIQNINHYPIVSFVVMSNPSSIIKRNPGDKNITQYVIKSQQLLRRIMDTEQKHIKEILDQKQLRKLCKGLLKSHAPDSINVLKQYRLTQTDLITGVECPSCQHIPMLRKKRNWYCEKCQYYSKIAHEKAVIDYLTVINPTITNNQFRTFTNISSIHVATRLLNSMELAQFGKNKGRYYTLKKE